MEESSTCTKPVSCLWIIKNFQNWPVYEGNKIKSARFPSDENEEKNWRITLSSEYHDAWLEPSLELETNDTNVDIMASIRILIIDGALREINEERKCHFFKYKSEPCFFRHFIKLNSVLNRENNILFHEDLIMYCQISISNAPWHSKDYDRRPSASYHQLSNSLGQLLEEEAFSDFLIEVKDKQFLCHKAILACRSEYFAALLQHGMKEKKENKLVLTDIEPNTFEKLLRYIYTGVVDASEIESCSLLLAADKFGMDRLMIICEEKLHSCLCLENAMEVFSFASFYNLQGLKMNAFRIVSEFVNRLPDSDLFKIHPCTLERENSTTQSTGELEIEINTPHTIADGAEIMEGNKDVATTTTVSRLETTTTKTFPPKHNFWCQTESRPLVKSTWSIKNFRNYDLYYFTTICSHIVTSDEATWQIDIDIDKTTNHDKNRHGFLTLYLKLVSCKDGKSSLLTEYTFSILNIQHNEKKTLRGTCVCTLNEYMKLSSTFIKVDDILSSDFLLHGDDLVLCCSFVTRKSVLYEFTYPSIPQCDLEENLSCLLNDLRFTDVTIKVQGERFLCHKAILACQSSFFAARFKEVNSPEDVIEIEGLEPSTFRKIRSALYTGKCELEVPELMALISPTNRSFLLNTPIAFEDVLISALSIENAAKILAFADSHKAEKLKKYTLRFIGRNLEQVVDTPEWADVSRQGHLITACFKETS